MLPFMLAPDSARSWLGLAAVATAAALTGVVLAAAGSAPAPAAPAALAVAPIPVAVLPASPPAMALSPSPSPEAGRDAAPASPLMFVFHAGGATYVKLADLEDPDGHSDALAMPRHGRPRLSRRGDDGVTAAIASVAERDVPGPYTRWQDRRVEVDEVCTASVVGFAVVSRLVGAPERAGELRWTARNVMRSGHAVLAARLDGCIGSFARAPALPCVR